MTAIRRVPDVRPEPRVCADCGEPIMPGQLYLVGEPLHVYCGHPEGREWGWWQRRPATATEEEEES